MKDRAILSLAVAAVLAGCAPVIETHGYTPVPEAVARIEPGIDTRASVQIKIGRPSHTGAFDERGWYYVSSTVEHFTFYAPEVISRKVVAVAFDDAGVVTEVNTFDLEDGRVIDLAAETTPTYGRQLTFVEQIVSNIGTVAGSEIFDE